MSSTNFSVGSLLEGSRLICAEWEGVRARGMLDSKGNLVF